MPVTLHGFSPSCNSLSALNFPSLHRKITTVAIWHKTSSQMVSRKGLIWANLSPAQKEATSWAMVAEPRASVIPNYSSAEIFIQVLHWLVTYSRGTHHHSPQCKGCPYVMQHAMWIILDSGPTSTHPTFPSLSILFNAAEWKCLTIFFSTSEK